MPKNFTNKSGELRELTRAEIAAMRPMREIDPLFIARFKEAKRKRGRPAGRNKAVVSMSVDKDVLELLRASGSGWQSRVNNLLRAAVGLQS
jgi:uncharacterized protein (DUF4415 family)